MSGPVGGAGELTPEKLVESWESVASYCSDRGYKTALQSCASELRQSLAAKAPQGVPSREQFERELYASDEQLTHKAIMRVFDAAAGDRPSSEGGGLAANPGYPAPESTGGPQKMAALPVPGPVSDTTIHHGMFPPAPSGGVESLTPRFRKVAEWLEPMVREAAAPKPAPGYSDAICSRCNEPRRNHMGKPAMSENCSGFEAAPAPLDHSRCSLCGAPRIALDRAETRFGACTFVDCKDPLHDFHVENPQGEPMPTFGTTATTTTVSSGMARDLAELPTPAPGAERLPSRGQLLSAIEQGIANWRVYGSSEIQDEGHLKGMIIEQLYRTPALREALAAAPPAVEPVLVGKMRQFAEECLRRHAINPKYSNEIMHTKDTYHDLLKLCDMAEGHASAERVRPLRDGLERLTKATANFTGSQRSKERVKEALRVAMEILTDDDKKLAGALPPSTGEKGQ